MLFGHKLKSRCTILAHKIDVKKRREAQLRSALDIFTFTPPLVAPLQTGLTKETPLRGDKYAEETAYAVVCNILTDFSIVVCINLQ